MDLDNGLKIKNGRNNDSAYRQIELSVDILIKNIIDIQRVNDWAGLVGYSRAHFCRKFTREFGENPKMVLRRTKFRRICSAIQSDWSATAYKIALDVGMQNEKALHKFLSRNFQLNFMALKDQLKRDAFRARKYVFRAADADESYQAAYSSLSDNAD
ncbi:MAG: helix-turn-helix domain-containing protein [Balneolales bacterium]